MRSLVGVVVIYPESSTFHAEFLDFSGLRTSKESVLASSARKSAEASSWSFDDETGGGWGLEASWKYVLSQQSVGHLSWHEGLSTASKLWIGASWYIRSWQSADADALVRLTLDLVTRHFARECYAWNQMETQHPKRKNFGRIIQFSQKYEAVQVQSVSPSPGLAEHCRKLWIGRNFYFANFVTNFNEHR